MPGQKRCSLAGMMKEVEESWGYGVKTFVLFPKVPDNLKTNYGEESYNPNGIVHRALRMIKEKYPDSIVCTDVALDPYSDQGHDGIVKDGKILNDETIEQLCKQAVSQVGYLRHDDHPFLCLHKCGPNKSLCISLVFYFPGSCWL